MKDPRKQQFRPRTADASKSAPPPENPPERLPPLPGAAAEPFFRRVDWAAFWTASLLALIVYVCTLAPALTLEDSGELAVGSDHLGVPHPPGYPIWTIITWVFTRVFAFVRFRGQPNPAWSVGLASAVFGAFASGITAILICRSGRDMLRSIKHVTERIGTATESVICWAGGVAASLVFAFNPVNWSQSVIVEVYSLNAFFLVLVLFLAYVWMRRPSERLPYLTAFVFGLGIVCLLVMYSRVVLHLMRYSDVWQVGIYYVLGILLITGLAALAGWLWVRSPNDRLLYLTALVFGFGLTNYQVLLLLIVSLVLVVLLKDLALFRDFVIAGAPYVVVYYLIQKGALPKISHPTDTVTYIYGGLNFLALGLAYALLPHGRCVAPTILFAELGVSVYVFMPLASETNPPINWGYPRTWEGFLHALTRGQYERIAPTSMFSAQFVRQFGDYLSDLRSKFTLPVALLGTLPFTAWSARVGAGRVRALYASIALSVVAVCLITVEEFVMPTGVELRLLSQLYRVLIFLVAVLMGIGGAALLIGRIREFAGRLADARAPLSEKLTAGCVLLAGTAAVAFYAFVLLGKLVDPALQGDPKTRAGILVLLLAPAAIAGLVAYLMLGRARLELEMDAEGQKWVIGTLAGFAVMSMVLIVLANPKGDIQDEFIQRVKFISSHALFAFWIGYGLVFGLAYADNITRGNRLVKWAGIGVTLLLPVIPLLQNAYNQELLRTDGGAEMYGHDFGWQFGNYQLRGAPALLEELSPDEEPLPNPAFPPEMGPRAVFFGGTDPGRFVPTYMIYCADVRSDVYLITQNALADNTYMSVMRDLYGDTIWIPSVVDGNFAFQKYVEDVRAGRVPASADIKIENGRVSVQGVGGVMLINGILAQMIFEHNKAVHDFYVEESYVIQWMYPYLTPHGLIMKINRDPLPTLPADVVRDDMDFWDWYTRRLTGDVRFQRDVVARKSFSKLRSAIAGVYAVRGQFAEAERSFLDALELYPLSPEANFRLADLYTRWNRFDDAIRVMEEFARQDPNNDRAGGFANELKNRRDLTNRRKELEAELASGKASVGRALDLADVYRKMGLQEPFMALTRSLLDNPEMPPPVFLRLAQLYIEEKKFDLVVRALEGYVARVPADMKGWLDLTAVQAALQKTDDALRSAQQAVRVGGEAARNVLREDKRFDLLRSLPAFRALAGSATPLLLAP